MFLGGNSQCSIDTYGKPWDFISRPKHALYEEDGFDYKDVYISFSSGEKMMTYDVKMQISFIYLIIYDREAEDEAVKNI